MMLRVQSCSVPVMGADKENLDSGKKSQRRTKRDPSLLTLIRVTI